VHDDARDVIAADRSLEGQYLAQHVVSARLGGRQAGSKEVGEALLTEEVRTPPGLCHAVGVEQERLARFQDVLGLLRLDVVEQPDGLTVIEPGSDHPSHIAAITSAGQVRHILLTHTHPDHLTGAAELHAATGAPIATWATPWAPDFHPHIPLAHGQTLAGLRAIHTPGHASDHLCFEHATPGIVFTGDHVMSWSTSIVSPPDGDMAAYMASLRLLLARQDTLYLCGHGPPLAPPPSSAACSPTVPAAKPPSWPPSPARLPPQTRWSPPCTQVSPPISRRPQAAACWRTC